LDCVWNQDLKTNHERAFQVGINVFRYAMGSAPLRRPLDGTSKPIPATASPPTEPTRTGGDVPALK
jgi:hypothetical protein